MICPPYVTIKMAAAATALLKAAKWRYMFFCKSLVMNYAIMEGLSITGVGIRSAQCL